MAQATPFVWLLAKLLSWQGVCSYCGCGGGRKEKVGIMTPEELEKFRAEQSRGMQNIYPTGQFIECLFSVGDRVKLKSGGPDMTVSDAVLAKGMLECTYFHDGQQHHTVVHQKCLSRLRWWSWIF